LKAFGSYDRIWDVFNLTDSILVGYIFPQTVIGYDDELVVMVEIELNQMRVRYDMGVQETAPQESGLLCHTIYSAILKKKIMIKIFLY
jgi:hypothetical protein